MEDIVKTRLGPDGRVLVPASLRKHFRMLPGQAVNLYIEPDGIKVSTPEIALRRLQERFRDVVPKGVSLVDELIADRRKEAENE